MNNARAGEIGDLLLVCLTVLLFCMAFPGGRLPWLGWLAFMPLAMAIHGKTAREAFMIATVTTFICWFAATWWLIPGVSRSANTPWNITLLFEFLFCLAYAVPYGIAGMLTAAMGWSGTIPGALKSALLWTAICGLTPHILPGNLAHTQYGYPCMIQIVELGGIPMLLFAIYLTTWLCVAAARNIRNGPTALVSLLLAAAIPAGIFAYGHLRLETVRKQLAAPETPRLTVGWIQPNFTTRDRNREAWEDKIALIEEMTCDLTDRTPAPDLIVWPEMPPPVSYCDNPEDRNRIDSLVARTDTPMLVTGYLQKEPEEGSYYNAMTFIQPTGPFETYKKQRLLPFGEYLPGEEKFETLRELFPNALKYQPGKNGRIFTLDDDIRLIPLICYEAIFPEMVAEGKAMGGNVVINPVNDAWFGRSAGPEIHLALALFRAVEFRTPVVRVANSGIGAAISATGELDAAGMTPLFEPCIATATVKVSPLFSLYAVTGDLFLWGCALGSMVFLWIDVKKRGIYRGKTT